MALTELCRFGRWAKRSHYRDALTSIGALLAGVRSTGVCVCVCVFVCVLWCVFLYVHTLVCVFHTVHILLTDMMRGVQRQAHRARRDQIKYLSQAPHCFSQLFGAVRINQHALHFVACYTFSLAGGPKMNTKNVGCCQRNIIKITFQNTF